MSDADDPDAPEDADEAVRDVVRVDGPDPSDEDEGDDEGPPVGRDGVMDPEDLDIRGRDGVDETEDGRYVISTGGGRHDDLRDPGALLDDDQADAGGSGDDPNHADRRASVADPEAETSGHSSPDSEDDPLAAVAAELGALSASHGFALAVAAGGDTDTLRVASADPTDTLATALRWYARRVNPGEPPEETLRELIAASDLALDVS
ncbi:DUF7500 family protein [Halobaculum marinum]|uniref:Uncharacterized protein n=1 Tax=Halobaculum marinum TaxID=3031996 RepID=A0ABD5WW44_9EURY|nr:hypothetical protein [Halobaculum sp. DT55]